MTRKGHNPYGLVNDWRGRCWGEGFAAREALRDPMTQRQQREGCVGSGDVEIATEVWVTIWDESGSSTTIPHHTRRVPQCSADEVVP